MATKKKKEIDPECVEFGLRIRRFREVRHLSQKAAAGLMDVERTSLNRWENGHEWPSLKAGRKLQMHLGVSVGPEPVLQEPSGQLTLPFDFEPYSLALRISPQRETVQFEVQLKKLGT
jgi:transcriptional regulator with XRE-family HTH domain